MKVLCYNIKAVSKGKAVTEKSLKKLKKVLDKLK